jgi:hypothetical protein
MWHQHLLTVAVAGHIPRKRGIYHPAGLGFDPVVELTHEPNLAVALTTQGAHLRAQATLEGVTRHLCLALYACWAC